MNNIQKLRLKANLSQEQLANLLAIDRSTIAKWETGNALPRAEKLPYLAQILNCSIDELLGQDEEVDTKEVS